MGMFFNMARSSRDKEMIDLFNKVYQSVVKGANLHYPGLADAFIKEMPDILAQVDPVVDRLKKSMQNELDKT